MHANSYWLELLCWLCSQRILGLGYNAFGQQLKMCSSHAPVVQVERDWENVRLIGWKTCCTLVPLSRALSRWTYWVLQALIWSCCSILPPPLLLSHLGQVEPTFCRFCHSVVCEIALSFPPHPSCSHQNIVGVFVCVAKMSQWYLQQEHWRVWPLLHEVNAYWHFTYQHHLW